LIELVAKAHHIALGAIRVRALPSMWTKLGKILATSAMAGG
jgi:hypothetical protein